MRSAATCLLVCVATACVTHTTRVLAPYATVVVARPMIVGVFPPLRDVDVERDPGLARALPEFRAALDAVRACVAEDGVVVQPIYADYLVLEWDHQRFDVAVGRDPAGIGCVLATPGRAPERVAGTDVPGGLASAVRIAAARYFGIPRCRVAS